MFFVSLVSHVSRLFIAWKGLTSWLLLVLFIVFFVITFPCGILGQVWYLIVSFPDLCRLSYFEVGEHIIWHSPLNYNLSN